MTKLTPQQATIETLSRYRGVELGFWKTRNNSSTASASIFTTALAVAQINETRPVDEFISALRSTAATLPAGKEATLKVVDVIDSAEQYWLANRLEANPSAAHLVTAIQKHMDGILLNNKQVQEWFVLSTVLKSLLADPPVNDTDETEIAAMRSISQFRQDGLVDQKILSAVETFLMKKMDNFIDRQNA